MINETAGITLKAPAADEAGLWGKEHGITRVSVDAPSQGLELRPSIMSDSSWPEELGQSEQTQETPTGRPNGTSAHSCSWYYFCV